MILIADFLANSYFVKKYGASKWGERVAMVSLIIGSFIFPPFGLLIVPFISVFITEYYIQKDPLLALKASIGTLMGFLSGTLAKGIIQFIMIILFLFQVWL